MIEAENFLKQRYVGRYMYANFLMLTMTLCKLSALEKTVAEASGVFRDVCSEEPRITQEKNCKKA